MVTEKEQEAEEAKARDFTVNNEIPTASVIELNNG